MTGRKTVNRMWHIAFVVKEKDCSVIITEHLRYAGTISTSAGQHTTAIPYNQLLDLDIQSGEAVIIIHEPKGINGAAWARTNEERIRSFGTKVVSYSQR